MRKRWIALGVLACVGVGLFVVNASMFARPQGALSLLAHRGIAQTFSHVGLDNDTCTATRIDPPTHSFLENTIPSMRAAFAAGASMVEIDIHPTTDNDFAVFHDWTLPCRTNGQGVTREHSMDYLRTLDLGYGYSADGGETFPLRGQGVAMMPSLRDVLAAFPSERFLVNFKSNEPGEADALLTYLAATPAANIARLSFYGARPAERMRELRPDLITTSRKGLIRCARDYLLTGWYGATPGACRNSILFVPSNVGWLAWGWPNRFLDRMHQAGSEIYIVAPLKQGERPGVNGIDDAQTFAQIPRAWRGGVTTDAIEVIGPLAAAR